MKVRDLKEQYDVTNIALFDPDSHAVTTNLSGKTLTGFELARGMEAAIKKVESLQEAIRNAGRLLEERRFEGNTELEVEAGANTGSDEA